MWRRITRILLRDEIFILLRWLGSTSSICRSFSYRSFSCLLRLNYFHLCSFLLTDKTGSQSVEANYRQDAAHGLVHLTLPSSASFICITVKRETHSSTNQLAIVTVRDPRFAYAPDHLVKLALKGAVPSRPQQLLVWNIPAVLRSDLLAGAPLVDYLSPHFWECWRSFSVSFCQPDKKYESSLLRRFACSEVFSSLNRLNCLGKLTFFESWCVVSRRWKTQEF